MSQKKVVILAILSMGVSWAGVAAADNDKEPGSGPNPFTDCGIGAALFPDTHWAAVTSNVIWDVGTTAVISATASPETCSGGSAKAARFINDTFDNVLEDTARGDGEYVVTLLEIYGCDKAVHGEIIDSIRGDVGAMQSADEFQDLSQTRKAESYFKVIDGEIRSEFSASCSA